MGARIKILWIEISAQKSEGYQEMDKLLLVRFYLRWIECTAAAIKNTLANPLKPGLYPWRLSRLIDVQVLRLHLPHTRHQGPRCAECSLPDPKKYPS